MEATTALAFTLYLITIYFFIKKKVRLVELFLFITALVVFTIAATQDNYLHVWDERFHALVGKNMVINPFKPMLYADPVLDKDYSSWITGHIWLHKQPLFMWQMALTMKLIGTSVFAIRLPGVILSALTVLAIFRSGFILINKNTGFFAALLMLTSYYWFGLVLGRNQTDQNDVAFISYISLSLWSWIEYEQSKNKKWLIAIGLFSGFAILCKWLVGLLVYAAWGSRLLLNRNEFLANTKNIIISLLITAAIVLPWQIYTSIKFPAEYKIEQEHNLEHLWKPLSFNEKDDYLYYVNKIEDNYDVIYPALLFIALLFFFFTPNNKPVIRGLIISFLFQFLFFSLAQSKMPSFAMAGWFVAILALAYVLQKIIGALLLIPFIKNKESILIILFAVMLVPTRFDFKNLDWQESRKKNPQEHPYQMLHNKKLLSNLNLPSDYVLFNVNGNHFVEAMFYTNIPVYNSFPSKEQVIELEKKNRRIAILKGKDNLPEYILNDSRILLIDGFTYINE